jgi:hypothetical protein
MVMAKKEVPNTTVRGRRVGCKEFLEEKIKWVIVITSFLLLQL